MKVTRNMLLIITASLGVLIILYSLFRHFTGKGLSEGAEKYMMDVVVIAALGLFLYNRKMAKEEKLAREAAAEKARRIAEGLPEEEPEPVEKTQDNDDNLPHWERRKKDEDQDASDEPADDGEEAYDDEEYEEEGEYDEDGDEDEFDPRR